VVNFHKRACQNEKFKFELKSKETFLYSVKLKIIFITHHFSVALNTEQYIKHFTPNK